jgi:hypothetical protein
MLSQYRLKSINSHRRLSTNHLLKLTNKMKRFSRWLCLAHKILSKSKSNHRLKQSHLNLRLRSRRVEGSTNRTHFCRISLLKNQTFRFQRSMRMKAYLGRQMHACYQKSIKSTEAIVVMDTVLIWHKLILSYTLISTLIA